MTNEGSGPRDPRGYFSLYDIIQQGKEIADIATAIEAGTLYTWDRFDRPVEATAGDINDPMSKAYALAQLERYYRLKQLEDRGQYDATGEMNCLEEPPDSPLFSFGWFEHEMPDFGASDSKEGLQQAGEAAASQKIEKEPAPNSVRSYLRLIRVLAHMAKLDISEPYKAAVILLAHGEAEGFPVPSNAKTFGDKLKEASRID